MSESKLWAKTFECLIAKDGVFEALKFGKLKRLQITQRFDDCLQNENSRESILTSIEFVEENSLDLQTLIKKLHDLIYERKESLAEAYLTAIEKCIKIS